MGTSPAGKSMGSNGSRNVGKRGATLRSEVPLMGCAVSLRGVRGHWEKWGALWELGGPYSNRGYPSVCFGLAVGVTALHRSTNAPPACTHIASL